MSENQIIDTKCFNIHEVYTNVIVSQGGAGLQSARRMEMRDIL